MYEDMSSQYVYFMEGDGLPLMFITHRTEKYTEKEQVKMALEGGCDWIQIRMKENLTLNAARELADLIRITNFSCHICIDDDLEIAIKSGAFCVHLGKRICRSMRHGKLFINDITMTFSLSELQPTPSKI